MDVSSSSALELHTVADVSHLHGVVLAKYHLFPEGLHPMLEIASGKEDISLHHGVQLLIHMVFQILLPGFFKGLKPVSHFHCDLFFAQLIHMIVYFAVLLLQLRCEVGAPPQVTRSEGEEDLEAVNQNIVKFDMNF